MFGKGMPITQLWKTLRNIETFMADGIVAVLDPYMGTASTIISAGGPICSQTGSTRGQQRIFQA